MRTSFHEEDVKLLLKDITGLVVPLPSSEREKKIQNGTHYSEMLPLERLPSHDYLLAYEKSLDVFGQITADAIAQLSEKIACKIGKHVVLVSLARAGTSLGILVKRYIRRKYGFDCPHYSISIIRDRGIDRNALDYILKRHDPSYIQFLDGWTGKGVIMRELMKELSYYDEMPKQLAVVSDPAGLTELCGTHDDLIIPSSCLNSTISGLISRTFYRKDIIGENDFHGAAYYKEFEAYDKTYEFIEHIEHLFKYDLKVETPLLSTCGMTDVMEVSGKYGIKDLNFIKPGIGETTRVLLRRIPWKILIDDRFGDSLELEHIKRLALEKHVPIEFFRFNNYKCCGLIRQLSDI